MDRPQAGGGWHAVNYTWKKGREAGGIWKLYRALRSKNACKTCALGMGGQKGGMVNESGHFPEVCKKSLQAMVADMQPAIADNFWREHTIEELKGWTPRQLEHAGRLVKPLIHRKGASHFEPIDWQLAMERVVGNLRATDPEKTFFYFSGRSSNEAGFLLQLFARLYGTNHVNNCSYYCHQASGVGLSSVTGSGTATIVLEDLDEADLVFVIGGNPASNHPRLLRTLMQVRRRGGHVVVVNPVVETGLVRFSVPSDIRSLFSSAGSEIASHYVQPHIGGDLAILIGIAKRLVETDSVDASFLESACEGWPAWKQQIDSTSWAHIEVSSGVERQEIEQIADLYASSRSTVFSWTMGITHHRHGVQNVQAIANLAMMRSMVGRRGAGLLPIRGHSNVQGIGSVGVTPALKQAIFERIEQQLETSLPQTPGFDTMACMEAAAQRELTTAICLGGNLYGSNPDSLFASQALRNLTQITYLSTTLNTGHVHGLAEETLILPVLARDEEPEATTQESMFNFVRLSDGGPSRLAGPRSEVEVIAALGEQIRPGTNGDAHPGSPLDWSEMRQTGSIRRLIAKVIPGYERIESLDKTKEEFQIAGRTFHTPQFATANGKAQLQPVGVPAEPKLEANELRLMTVRSEGQFNTVVYEDEDFYRGVTGRDVVLLHPNDIQRLGLAANERVIVRGSAGEMRNIRVHEFADIKPGNALMYYPEANVLLDRGVDPASKTPGFKGAIVSIASD